MVISSLIYLDTSVVLETGGLREAVGKMGMGEWVHRGRVTKLTPSLERKGCPVLTGLLSVCSLLSSLP